jgi:hypothetical protein
VDKVDSKHPERVASLRAAIHLVNEHPPFPMKSLSSLLSGALHKHGPVTHHRDHHYDKMGYLLAGGAGILQAVRARGYHRLVTLALAGGMLYKGLSGRGHGSGHGHAHGLIPVRANSHSHSHGLGRWLHGRK